MSSVLRDIMDKPALVSLTFDDGLRCQFERAVPILNQYGFLATFFLTANNESVHEPWLGAITKGWRKIDWRAEDIAALKALLQAGHEVGSHSISHHDKTMRQQPDDEARKSKKFIGDRLTTEISSFCYPYYHSHSYLARAVRDAGYKQARGGATGLSYYSSGKDVDWLNIDCRQITSKENVGAWIRPGCWHVLTFHGIGSPQDGWEPITESEFARQMADLAKHRESGAVEVVTFKDGADRLRRPK